MPETISLAMTGHPSTHAPLEGGVARIAGDFRCR
jgi:hypothetical protein